MTETLAYWNSSESTQRKLSNENQHDRVTMVFKNLCIIVIRMKVGLASDRLSRNITATVFAEMGKARGRLQDEWTVITSTLYHCLLMLFGAGK